MERWPRDAVADETTTSQADFFVQAFLLCPVDDM